MVDLRNMTGILFDKSGIIVVIKGVFYGPFSHSDKDKLLQAFDNAENKKRSPP